ncbi:pitrilysin family protein, partial [Azovibrio restrictus]|uniref:M16 family metallopeptidase n=1 Tax=Azovibrio restrictus TaxID=146938 RepID=UPI0026EE2FD7
AHPYRRPIIGWMNDLENMTARDAKAWYDQWYVPNNAILVVSGDVQHEQVFKLARQYYGPLKSRALPARKPQVEPQQKGMRRLVVKGPAELPLLLLGWKAPKVERLDGPVEPFALDMLAAILDGHDAARLGRSLVREQQLATSVGASYDGLNRGPAMFYLYGSPAPGQTPETLEKALRGELARIARDGVDEGELKRAKAQLIAAQVYKLDSVFGQAMEIGSMEVIGFSHKDVAALQARLEAVTAAQVQAAAQAWFGDDTLTVGLLEPLPPEAAPKGPKAAPAGRHH